MREDRDRPLTAGRLLSGVISLVILGLGVVFAVKIQNNVDESIRGKISFISSHDFSVSEVQSMIQFAVVMIAAIFAGLCGKALDRFFLATEVRKTNNTI